MAALQAITTRPVHMRAGPSSCCADTRAIRLAQGLLGSTGVCDINFGYPAGHMQGPRHLGDAPWGQLPQPLQFCRCVAMFWDFCLVHCDAHSFSSVRILAVAFVTLTLNWSWRTKQTEAETTTNNNVSFDFEALPCAAPNCPAGKQQCCDDCCNAPPAQ